MELNIILKLTVCIMMQSWLLTGVEMNPVLFNKLTASKLTFKGQEHPKLMEDMSNSTSSLAEGAEDDKEDYNPGDVNHGILSRLVRSTSDCVFKLERRWNKCLGRFYTKVHCRQEPIYCLPHGVPPKCIKKHQAIFGANGRACHVVKTCVCA